MKRIITILLLLSLPLFAQKLSKVYVMAEGGYSAGTSSLSMLDAATGTFEQNIFTTSTLGLYPDGLVFYNDTLYLAEQGSYGGSGKIYQLDTLGNVLNSAVVGVNPFSIAIANNKAYLTNGPDNSVSVVNLSDLSLDTTITVGVYPQEIIAYENYVFVGNTEEYMGTVDSTVMVIDAETDEIIDTIVVAPDPASFAITNDRYLLVGCSVYGYGDTIYKIDLTTFAKVDSFTVADYGFGKDISVDPNSNTIYFLGSYSDVVSLDLETGESSAVVSSTNFVYPYGYSYDYVNNTHYVADAKDFSANGSLTAYDSLGTVINSYETGVAPRRIVMKYVDGMTGIEDGDEVIAKEFRLNQNYPNPFNPTTKISFSIPAPSNVNLTVYNILGQKVTELLNKEMNAGSFEVNFNASKLASGIYYYRLQAGDLVSTKKMMLVK